MSKGDKFKIDKDKYGIFLANKIYKHGIDFINQGIDKILKIEDKNLNTKDFIFKTKYDEYPDQHKLTITYSLFFLNKLLINGKKTYKIISKGYYQKTSIN